MTRAGEQSECHGTSRTEAAADHTAWLALAQRLSQGPARDLQQVLEEITASGVCDLNAAVVPDGTGTVRIVAAAGETAADWIGRTGPAEGLRVAATLRDGRSRLIADATERLQGNVRSLLQVRSAAFAPLADADGQVWGVLTLGRYPAAPRYTETDLAMTTLLAGWVPSPDPGSAAGHAAARNAERDRIARSLNTEAIGRLFTLGMRLQGAATLAPAPLRQVLADSSDEIDVAVKAIRGAVYGLDG